MPTSHEEASSSSRLMPTRYEPEPPADAHRPRAYPLARWASPPHGPAQQAAGGQGPAENEVAFFACAERESVEAGAEAESFVAAIPTPLVEDFDVADHGRAPAVDAAAEGVSALV